MSRKSFIAGSKVRELFFNRRYPSLFFAFLFTHLQHLSLYRYMSIHYFSYLCIACHRTLAIITTTQKPVVAFNVIIVILMKEYCIILLTCFTYESPNIFSSFECWTSMTQSFSYKQDCTFFICEFLQAV